MSLMSFSQPRPKQSVIDAQPVKCRFVDVQKVSVRNTFPDAKTDMVDKLVWSFESTEVGDADGNPFVFKQWTSTYYGSDRSTLTKFIDSIFGRRFTQDELANVEATMPHLEFVLNIEKAVAQNGNEYNRIGSIQYRDPRVANAPKPLKKAVVEEPITDPFAE